MNTTRWVPQVEGSNALDSQYSDSRGQYIAATSGRRLTDVTTLAGTPVLCTTRQEAIKFASRLCWANQVPRARYVLVATTDPTPMRDSLERILAEAEGDRDVAAIIEIAQDALADTGNHVLES